MLCNSAPTGAGETYSMASRLGLESAEYLFGYGANRRCLVGGDFCNFLESRGITDFAQSSKGSDTHHHLWIGTKK